MIISCQIYGIDSDNRAIPVERNPVKIIYSTDACEEVCDFFYFNTQIETFNPVNLCFLINS